MGQKLLNLDLKLPEGGPTLYPILAFVPAHNLQKTEGIKNGMVATQVGGELLVTFSLVDVVIGVVNVREYRSWVLVVGARGRDRDGRDQTHEDLVGGFGDLLSGHFGTGFGQHLGYWGWSARFEKYIYYLDAF